MPVKKQEYKPILKSVLKSKKEDSPETGICVKCHQNVLDKYDNQPFAPIHIKGVDENTTQIRVSTHGDNLEEKVNVIKKKVRYASNEKSDKTEESLSKEIKDNFWANNGKKIKDEKQLYEETKNYVYDSTSSPILVKKERRDSVKKDRLDISYHLELFNDGPLGPEKQETPLMLDSIKIPKETKRKSPLFYSDRSTLFQNRVHKVSNPSVKLPNLKPKIEIENYDSTSSIQPPLSPIFTELPIKKFDTPISSEDERDMESTSTKFDPQKTWYKLYDRVKHHQDLPLPPTRQTRSYESLLYSTPSPVVYGPVPDPAKSRVRKISTPNPPTQPMMKSIDIFNLDYNDDLVDSNQKSPIIHDNLETLTKKPDIEEIKERSRKISRTKKTSIFEPPAPTVIYKCVYSFRSANTVETQCCSNIIFANFATFNDREIDAMEIEKAHRALELLEDYHNRLESADDRALRTAIERVIRIFKSRLFQALLVSIYF
uniref:CSON010754 protein n=1 Tax=Culicoides sonorensis TaxID=179676 RepID=A0A336M5Z6_CULSO